MPIKSEGKRSKFGRLGDLYYSYRFIKLISLPWEEWEAFKLGIIDDDGKVIKKHRIGNEEKNAYTPFHRLTRNLKRLLHKLPLGSRMISKAAAAYFLLREELVNQGGKSDVIDEAFLDYINKDDTVDLNEEIALKILVNESAVMSADVASSPSPLISDPDGYAMGMPYYTCSLDVYHKCVNGKRKTGRWQSHLDGDERAEGIKNWAKLNAKEGLMIQNEKTNAYTVLRRPSGPGRWNPHT